MLVDHRDQLSNRRVQTVNRLHRLLAELAPGKTKKGLTALQAKAILASVRPRDVAGKLEDRVERLIETNTPALLAFLVRRTSDPADAADLLGDTLLVIWRRAKALPGDDSEARLWIFGVARRVLANQRRRERRRNALQDLLRDQIAATAREPDTDGIDLAAALRQLPEVDQEIIRLVHWDGFRQAEAARLLGLPEGTVRSRHHRARQQLRGMLEGFITAR